MPRVEHNRGEVDLQLARPRNPSMQRSLPKRDVLPWNGEKGRVGGARPRRACSSRVAAFSQLRSLPTAKSTVVIRNICATARFGPAARDRYDRANWCWLLCSRRERRSQVGFRPRQALRRVLGARLPAMSAALTEPSKQRGGCRSCLALERPVPICSCASCSVLL
jgi:hypothetical protein